MVMQVLYVSEAVVKAQDYVGSQLQATGVCVPKVDAAVFQCVQLLQVYIAVIVLKVIVQQTEVQTVDLFVINVQAHGEHVATAVT